MKKLLTTLFFLNSSLYAAEIAREYRSARYLGQGNATTSMVTGVDAIFLNPAGIATEKSVVNEILLLSPQVIISSTVKDIYETVDTNEDPYKIIDLIADKPQHLSIQNFTGFIFRRMALGTIQTAELNAYLGTNFEKGILEADTFGTVRVGFVSTFSRDIIPDNLYGGITLKLIQKAQGRLTLDLITAQELAESDDGLTQILEDAVQRGTGVGADIGFIWSPKTAQNFKLGTTIRNIGNLNYSFTIPGDSPAPDPEKMQWDVGASVSAKSQKSELFLAADYKDILNAHKEITYKHIHVGAGINFAGIFGFQAGLNQGYATFGGFLSLKLIRAEAGVYAEELGKFPGDIKAHRFFGRLLVGWTQ